MNEHPDLDQKEQYEDEVYEERAELRCGSCGGLMDTCTLGDEVYYRCEDCGMGEAT